MKEPSPLSVSNNDEIDIVFCDVDGTLVHYPRKLSRKFEDDYDENIIQLPPSATGMQGIISFETLRLCQELRHRKGKKLVLVSGMRTTTLWKRIPYLPRADAYCSEGGGRIFYPIKVDQADVSSNNKIKGSIFSLLFGGVEDGEPFRLEEDLEWRTRMEATAGSESFIGNELYLNQNIDEKTEKASPLDQRKGILWDHCRSLIQEGYVVDTEGYSACFRVNRKHQLPANKIERFDKLLTNIAPKGLATSVNLGCVDFYPDQSGKRNCCEYLIQKLCHRSSRALDRNAVCLCDDDNDLEMALACKHVFVPNISSESMARVLREQKEKITVTAALVLDEYSNGLDDAIQMTRATERALSLLLSEWC